MEYHTSRSVTKTLSVRVTSKHIGRARESILKAVESHDDARQTKPEPTPNHPSNANTVVQHDRLRLGLTAWRNKGLDRGLRNKRLDRGLRKPTWAEVHPCAHAFDSFMVICNSTSC